MAGRTKQQCLAAAAHHLLMAAIRIEQDRLDNEYEQAAADGGRNDE